MLCGVSVSSFFSSVLLMKLLSKHSIHSISFKSHRDYMWNVERSMGFREDSGLCGTFLELINLPRRRPRADSRNNKNKQ